MTSTIKVNNVQNQCGTDIVKRCGATTTVGSGAGNTVVVCGSTVTIGRCGGTVALASGASQTGFGRTGTVDWQTGSIKTSTFTAANGEGYFANTSGGTFTMNLPAGTAGNIVSVVDYTNTFQTNKLTIAPNGSQKIGGTNASLTLTTEGQSVTFVYVDDTEGWKNVQDSTSNVVGLAYIVATGGNCVSTVCTNFKVHKFTAPGTFTVCSVGTGSNNKVDYMIVAGGGGGGYHYGGGGGGGGFRESKTSSVSGCWTASPLVSTCTVTVTAQGYPVVVGAGGASYPTPDGAVGGPGSKGSDSSVFSKTSTGGGFGGGNPSPGVPGGPGGSGGGAGGTNSGGSGGTGNDPSVSPPQGNSGGGPSGPNRGSGGGGAGGAGTACKVAGAGVATNISGSSVNLSGGGNAGPNTGQPTDDGRNAYNSIAPANSGRGAGGDSGYGGHGGGGGSGLVIIRYKFQ